LAVAAVAAARGSGIDVEFDIYGRGPATTAIDAQVRELGLEGKVRLMGSVSHQVLRERLPGYHAGFLPTRLDGMTRYSLSTKLLEYVHLGVPLIAARIPTYLEYFPEAAAWFFQPNDPEDAARAIRDFAATVPAERRDRAGRAQAAAAGLRWEHEAARLKEIYLELLAGRGG